MTAIRPHTPAWSSRSHRDRTVLTRRAGLHEWTSRIAAEEKTTGQGSWLEVRAEVGQGQGARPLFDQSDDRSAQHVHLWSRWTVSDSHVAEGRYRTLGCATRVFRDDDAT